MTVAYVVVTMVAVLANGGMVIGDLTNASFVVGNAREVGVPSSWLPTLAVLKALGAAGLAVGLLGLGYVGIAAAAGLVGFYVCAVGAHVRARVFYNIAFPGGYLAIAVGALVLAIVR